MPRILSALLALVFATACGVAHDEATDDALDPQAAEALAFDPGKADVPGIYQGEIELDGRWTSPTRASARGRVRAKASSAAASPGSSAPTGCSAT
jgi:hypothetical protein